MRAFGAALSSVTLSCFTTSAAISSWIAKMSSSLRS